MGVPVHVNIEEIRKPEIDAQLIADNIAQQLEKKNNVSTSNETSYAKCYETWRSRYKNHEFGTSKWDRDS